MSRDGSITLPFADGQHFFRYAWGQFRELQEKCDAGPMEILARLEQSRWRIDDVSEVLRIGLIGGGMKPLEAANLVNRYVLAQPPADNIINAILVLAAGIHGAPDEPVGEPQGEGVPPAKTRSPTEKSGLPESMPVAS